MKAKVRSRGQGRAIDMAGRRVGRLVVLGIDIEASRHHIKWRCVCDCGTEKSINGTSLRAGQVSCGCYRIDVISGPKVSQRAPRRVLSPAKRSWSQMKMRCSNPNRASWKNYGGRGIRVCDRWLESFENFLADMGPRPPGTSIDRIDNNGNYEPGNCRWATATQQGQNRRNVTTLDVAQEVLGRIEHGESPSSVASRLGLAKSTVHNIKRGKSWPDLDRPWLSK